MYPNQPFSRRHGFSAPKADITIREDAPAVVRSAVLLLASVNGLSLNTVRAAVCDVLLRLPDENNWSPDPVREETAHLIFEAPWYRVYDIAEHIHDRVQQQNWEAAQAFSERLNEVFYEFGVGYEMKEGRIVGRGSLAFHAATEEAVRLMTMAYKQTAATEMTQALSDLKRRPPDITGAVQHGMAALECTARDVMEQPSASLGQLIPHLGLTKPLDEALTKLWGYASQYGRHVAEGMNPRFEEAEVVVTVTSAVSVFLLRRSNPNL